MAKKYYKENGVTIPAIVFADLQPDGFTEVTEIAELRDLHMNRYTKATEAGVEFYNEFRTNLYLNIVNGSATPTDAFLVESHLKNLADQIVNGNWLTAKYTNENLPLSGIYNQSLKNSIQERINNYILNNY